LLGKELGLLEFKILKRRYKESLHKKLEEDLQEEPGEELG
jgi:hypothetical protein